MPPSYRFIRDVTIDDDEQIPAGQTFTKTWRVQNTGDSAWGTGFALSHVDGRAMTPNTHLPLPACQPGEQVDVSVTLTAPPTLGTHFSDWRMRDASGEFFGEPLWTRITVVAAPVSRPVSGTNDMIYIADVTVDDDQEMEPGASFTKTWRIKNTGTLSWGPGYTLTFEKGTAMTTQTRVPMPTCAPGQECDVSITLAAPTEPGKYFSDWHVQDPEGNVFGVLLWFRIVVPSRGRLIDHAPRPKPEIAIKAPHFSQRDKRWRAKVLGHQGSPVTLGSWGCLLTCYAMIANTMGHATDPAELNDTMVARGGFFQGHLTSWDALQTVFGDVVYEGKEDAHPGILTSIDARLANLIPVPVLVDRTPATRYNDNDQHWVLVLARNGTNDYWVNDPIDLDPDPASLMERYGRTDGTLRSAIRSAIFYRKR